MRKVEIGNLTLNMDELKGKQELMRHLEENGPTHSALMDFCEEYREKYCNELCWPYPISDGKHHGTFLVLVREGILSLPYNEAREEDYEVFCPDDTMLFEDYADMGIFLDDWKMFSNDLLAAMESFRKYLYGLEQTNEEN